jgi:hypothetical protein
MRTVLNNDCIANVIPNCTLDFFFSIQHRENRAASASRVLRLSGNSWVSEVRCMPSPTINDQPARHNSKKKPDRFSPILRGFMRFFDWLLKNLQKMDLTRTLGYID